MVKVCEMKIFHCRDEMNIQRSEEILESLVPIFRYYIHNFTLLL